jgi:hypothetical protein
MAIAKCTRCGEDASVGQCKVPHPKHMRIQGCMSFGPDGARADYSCEACGESYTLCEKDGVKSVEGPEFCFVGEHTTGHIDSDDERRVYKGVVNLSPSGGSIQHQLDNLEDKANITVVTIMAEGSFCEEEYTFELNLPKLQELTIEDCAVQKLVLNDTLTPQLKKLKVQNAADEVEWLVECSNLEEISVNYLRPADDEMILKMLEKANKLVRWDSYKLHIMGEIVFISTQLEHIRIHRADCLQEFAVYSPVLRNLDLQACYDIQCIGILEEWDGFPKIDNTTASKFRVNLLNACLPEGLEQALRDHERVERVDGADGMPMGGLFGNPMEAFFAQMHGQMMQGNFDFGDSDEDDSDSDGMLIEQVDDGDETRCQTDDDPEEESAEEMSD